MRADDGPLLVQGEIHSCLPGRILQTASAAVDATTSAGDQS
jgi:hypothetical protein